MKRLLTQTNKTVKTPSRKLPYIIILMFALASVLTGCGFIAETFGKDYRLVNDFFDQLEADIRYSVEEYISDNDITLSAEQEDELTSYQETISANIKILRSEMKSMVADPYRYYLATEGFDYNLPEKYKETIWLQYIEEELQEIRTELEERFKNSRISLELKHAEVRKNDFLGSAWDFVKSNWIIILVVLGILGIIGAIKEKVEHAVSSKNSKESGEQQPGISKDD